MIGCSFEHIEGNALCAFKCAKVDIQDCRFNSNSADMYAAQCGSINAVACRSSGCNACILVIGGHMWVKGMVAESCPIRLMLSEAADAQLRDCTILCRNMLGRVTGGKLELHKCALICDDSNTSESVGFEVQKGAEVIADDTCIENRYVFHACCNQS